MKRFIFKIILLPATIFNYINFKIRRIEYGENLDIKGVVGLYRSGRLMLGNNVKINSCRYANPLGDKMVFEISKDAVVRIGNNVGISGTTIKAFCDITIEDEVLIGAGCLIMDTDSHPLEFDRRYQKYDKMEFTKAIIIKRGAFIGARTIILKGVTIGEKSVIAAGSVVTKSIPDNELWGGSPAMFIKKLI